MNDNILNILIGALAVANISVIMPKNKEFYFDIKTNIKKAKLRKEKSKAIKIALIEDFQDIDFQKNSLPHVKFSENDRKKIKILIQYLEKNNKEIYFFIKKLLKHTDINNLKNLIFNLPYITIKYHSTNPHPNFNGTFDGLTKEINIYRDNTKATLYHELLHAATADERLMCVGFKNVLKNGIVFGRGLNEGYTELLNNRFFGADSESYIYLQKLAQEIENLCESKEKMIENYFNADIFSLINDLMKKMSLKQIIDILVDMDYLVYEDNPSYLQYIKIKEKIWQSQSQNKIKKALVKTIN